MSFFSRSNLNRKILLSVISVSIVMFSLVSAVTVWRERTRMVEAANDKAGLDVKENINVIAHDLWNFDGAALTATLKGLTLSGTIVKAEVVDKDKVIAAVARSGFAGDIDQVWSVDVMGPEDFRKIGTLRVTLSYDSLRRTMAYNMIASIASELIKISALAAILFVIIHQMLTRHLNSIASQINGTGDVASEGSRSIVLKRRFSGSDELDTLVDAINHDREERARAEEELRRDILERMRIESALQDSEASLSDAMRIARLGYWEYDIALDRFTFNDQYYALHKTSIDEQGGIHMSLAQFAARLLFEEDAAHVVATLQSAIQCADQWFLSQIETRIVCAGNELRWVLIRFKLQTGHDGSLVKLIGTNQDVTDRKVAEQQAMQLTRLSAQKQAAEIANQAKSRFFAAASHDLRQPIHALHLFLGTLNNLVLPVEARWPLDNVLRCTESIDQMFVSLLDVAKFDAGMITPQKSDFPIATLLNRICHECAQFATAQGLTLRVVPSSAWVHSDPLMVERILRNLVTNAIRYTPSGKILVGCRRRPNDQIELMVCDTGIGISTDQQELIFNEFYKASDDDIHQAGLGLGLSIVDQLAKLLDAPLRLRSVQGRGSVFALSLPKSKGEGLDDRVVQRGAASDELAGLSVLLIDDDQIILDATESLLQQWGCVLTTATDIQSAIDKLIGSSQLPQLLMCDFRLRGRETGVDAIRLIREELNADIPALIITADTSPTHIQYLRNTGLLVLHKPLREAELKAALVALLHSHDNVVAGVVAGAVTGVEGQA